MKYLLIILLTLLSMAAADCTKSKSPEEQAAYAASQAAVQQRLSIPGAAFPEKFEADKTADSIITINSYVDARNAQGSIIRHKYVAQLKYRSGDKAAAGSWSVEDVSFD